MSAGGWIFSLELGEMPDTNALVPIPFLRSHSSALFAPVVLWDGGGVRGKLGSSLSESPGEVHWGQLRPGSESRKKT